MKKINSYLPSASPRHVVYVSHRIRERCCLTHSSMHYLLSLQNLLFHSINLMVILIFPIQSNSDISRSFSIVQLSIGSFHLVRVMPIFIKIGHKFVKVVLRCSEAISSITDQVVPIKLLKEQDYFEISF